jgi:hypothetical protein
VVEVGAAARPGAVVQGDQRGGRQGAGDLPLAAGAFVPRALPRWPGLRAGPVGGVPPVPHPSRQRAPQERDDQAGHGEVRRGARARARARTGARGDGDQDGQDREEAPDPRAVCATDRSCRWTAVSGWWSGEGGPTQRCCRWVGATAWWTRRVHATAPWRRRVVGASGRRRRRVGPAGQGCRWAAAAVRRARPACAAGDGSGAQSRRRAAGCPLHVRSGAVQAQPHLADPDVAEESGAPDLATGGQRQRTGAATARRTEGLGNQRVDHRGESEVAPGGRARDPPGRRNARCGVATGVHPGGVAGGQITSPGEETR